MKKSISTIALVSCIIFSTQLLSQPWTTTGNATAATDFLGTTNGQPLNFFTANSQKASLSVAGDFNLTLNNRSYQIGGNNVLWHKGVASNIFVGVNSGTANVTGIRNTFVGANSGASNVGRQNAVFTVHT